MAYVKHHKAIGIALVVALVADIGLLEAAEYPPTNATEQQLLREDQERDTVIRDLQRRVEELERQSQTGGRRPPATATPTPPPKPPQEAVRPQEEAPRAAPGQFEVDEYAAERALERTLAAEARQTVGLRANRRLWPLTAQVVCVAMLNAETLRGQVLYTAEDFEENSEEEDSPVKFVPCMDESELIGAFWEVARHYDAVVTFKEYPHTDPPERAEELFTIIADAMEFVDHNTYDLARLEEERRLAARRAARGITEE